MNPDQTPVQPPAETPAPSPEASEQSWQAPVVPQSPAPSAGPSTFAAPPVAPAPMVGAAPAGGEDPGKTLGIVGFVMSLLGFGPISMVISIIAKSKSKKAGHSNGLALAGIIISAIGTVVGTLFVILMIMGASAVIGQCQELGPGTHTMDSGAIVTCS